jgi:hypothetical protein
MSRQSVSLLGVLVLFALCLVTPVHARPRTAGVVAQSEATPYPRI